MPGRISDSELRLRLEEHNYNVPPITDTTRSVLVKKLRQLDMQRKPRSFPAAGIDYSSAEEDFTPPASSTKKNSRLSRARANNGESTPQNGIRATPISYPASSDVRQAKNGGARSLMHQSEDDEEDSEDIDVEEESDEKCDDYDEDEVSRADQGVQTSFNTPDAESRYRSTRTSDSESRYRNPVTSSSESRYRNTGTSDSEQRYRGRATPDSETRFRGRTPQDSEIRFRGKSISNSGLSPTSPSYSLHSQHLRKNLDKFGSLNEALLTLPSNKSNPNLTPVARSQPSPAPSNPLTQVSRPPRSQYNRRENTGNSMLISSLIIVLAILFFAFLGYLYLNLNSTQPHQNIPLCVSIQDENSTEECIPGTELPGTMELLKKVLKIVKDDSSTRTPSFPELKVQLGLEQGETELENYLKNVIILMKHNPNWGIEPVYKENQITHLAVADNSFRIVLWTKYLVYLLLGFLIQAANYILLILILWLVFNGWKKYQARKERRRQEMFVMVDKVLSMLRDHHLNREGHGPTYLAIDHIRDQLIPPQERENMSETWKSTLKYLSKHESRVREEIQDIQGEDFRVWQWLPDIAGSPIPPRPGHRLSGPYSRGSPGSLLPSPSNRPGEILNKSNPWPYVSTSSSRSPEWQGSAFNLNRNVSVPTDPPTSCLKIRYMFDPLNLEHNWIMALNNDIITKCGGARILHIAVDRESREGVVYIKTMGTEDAGIVFNCLHNQWYKKQLVTVKYLRRDRYHQRFPDSVKAETPLTVKQ